MTGSTTSPFGIDTTVPTTARMYDFWLGGLGRAHVTRAARRRLYFRGGGRHGTRVHKWRGRERIIVPWELPDLL